MDIKSAAASRSHKPTAWFANISGRWWIHWWRQNVLLDEHHLGEGNRCFVYKPGRIGRVDKALHEEKRPTNHRTIAGSISAPMGWDVGEWVRRGVLGADQHRCQAAGRLSSQSCNHQSTEPASRGSQSFRSPRCPPHHQITQAAVIGARMHKHQ